MEVIAEKGGLTYLIWEGEGTPGMMDGVVTVRRNSVEGFRYMLGSFFGCGYLEEPNEDTPAAEALMEGISITDYMWLLEGRAPRHV